MMFAMTTSSIALTLGTGKVGSRVARRLDALGVAQRVGSRRGHPAFDWNESSTWAPFVASSTSVFVAYVPDLGFPGASEALAKFGETCASEGVENVVLLSGRGEPGAALSERALAEGAGPVTVVRCSWFDQNFSESFLLQPVLDGVIALPAGDVEEPFLDADDIADVVVACLTDPEAHRGMTYELTGPELLGFTDVARILSEVTGRTISYLPVDVDSYVAAAVEAGLPADDAHDYAELFDVITDGRNAHLTSDVHTVLGRTPTTFERYASATASTGVWDR
jgi:uncharacterized protein YbjT (DUF2867 family)